MFAGRTKSIIAISSFLAVLLCLLGGIGIITMVEKKNACYKERAPLRTIVISMDTSQQEQLFEQFREFANKYSFAIQIRPTSPTGKDFVIVMTRKDVEVIANNPFEWGKYDIGFYNNDCIHPTVASDIDRLVSDLKSLLSQIPNATITEEH